MLHWLFACCGCVFFASLHYCLIALASFTCFVVVRVFPQERRGMMELSFSDANPHLMGWAVGLPLSYIALCAYVLF